MKTKFKIVLLLAHIFNSKASFACLFLLIVQISLMNVFFVANTVYPGT